VLIGIYARVSTEEQAKKGFSLKDQIKECRKKANSAEIIEYIDDGYSGEFMDRPALTQLRGDARKGLIDKVVCLDPDRLSRKLMNQLIITDELDKREIKLEFVNGEYAKTPEGNLFYSLRGAISEFEKAKIKERTSRGRKEKAKQGKVLRDFVIYGYTYNKQTEQLEIKEEEAKVVKLIFDLFTKPNNKVKGINGIAKLLTAQGIPTKRGAKVWHRQVVRQILLNPVYMGEFYQNKWNTEGMLGNQFRSKEEKVSMKLRSKDEWIKIPCPPIVDEATYHHAQKIIKDSRRRFAKESLYSYLLSGLLRCGKCGNTLTGRKARNWGKYEFEYTDKKNYSGAKHPGCGFRMKCEELDSHVWNQLLEWLDQPEEITATIADGISPENEIGTFEQVEMERLEREIEKTKKARKKVLKLFAFSDDEGMTEEEIKQSIRELKDREDEVEQKLQMLQQKVKQDEEHHDTAEVLRDAAEYYLSKKGEQELTFEDKQHLIRQVVREIVLYDDRVEIYTF
jgi:site-specific DNA recombinase